MPTCRVTSTQAIPRAARPRKTASVKCRPAVGAATGAGRGGVDRLVAGAVTGPLDPLADVGRERHGRPVAARSPAGPSRSGRTTQRPASPRSTRIASRALADEDASPTSAGRGCWPGSASRRRAGCAGRAPPTPAGRPGGRPAGRGRPGYRCGPARRGGRGGRAGRRSSRCSHDPDSRRTTISREGRAARPGAGRSWAGRSKSKSEVRTAGILPRSFSGPRGCGGRCTRLRCASGLRRRPTSACRRRVHRPCRSGTSPPGGRG